MDYMDWVKESNDKFGTSDEDWDFLNQAAVIRFDYDAKGNVSGMYRGKYVYRDGYHELDINPGEIWVVSLSLNPKTNNNYFAKPLMRIDGSFLYELKKDQIDSLAKHLWEDNKVILEPALEEKYKDVVNEQIAKAVKEQTEAVIQEKKALEDKIQELQRINKEDKEIIESKEEEINLLSAKVLVMKNEPDMVAPKPAPQAQPEPVGEFTEQVKPPKNVIIRAGPDMLRSESFKKSRYFVHMSADHKSLLIRDDKNGNVVCMDNTILLAGLNTILPFTEECVLPSEYSSRYGGTIVALK